MIIVILKPTIDQDSSAYQAILQRLSTLSQTPLQIHQVKDKTCSLTEIYLLNETADACVESIEALPGVAQAVKLSKTYKILGRPEQSTTLFEFEYNGITFSQNNLNIFAGLCAVDDKKTVQMMMQALKAHGQHCTRMGAYKPRTSPHTFQGLGQSCLPYIFELAGQYEMKVVCLEVTHERQIDEVNQALKAAGYPTGIMLQVGTRNAQNFELLRELGNQHTFPILFKRGYGITLSESLHAAEYLAKGGNQKIIFCLRGVKSLASAPHRNLVDFAHIPIIKRLTCMPVCIDPSHSVGISSHSPDNISDIYHATAQGVIAGANMILVDFHPYPPKAIVDSRQALAIDKLGWYLEDIAIARHAYEKRQDLAKQWLSPR